MKRYRIVVLAVAVAAVLALAACSSGATTTPTGTTGGGTSSSSATVSMVGLAFNPTSVDIAVGGTVTFVNDDTVQHNVAGESWSSGPMDPGKSFTQTFSTAGAIAVRCTIHPSMTMTVNVK